MRSRAIEIIKKANNVDINIVTKLLMEKGLLGKKKAGDKGFLCPYHSEKSGSFLIYKNRGKCFGCEISVTAPVLYADVHLKNSILKLSKKNPTITSEELLEIYEREKHLALWEAAVDLCDRAGIISASKKQRHLRDIEKCRKTGINLDIYPKYYKKTSLDGSTDFEYDPNSTLDQYVFEISTMKDVSNKILDNYDFSAIASKKGLHIVYSALRESIIEVRGDALFPHHREHLNKKRFLSDEYIDYYKYFSLPAKHEMRKVVKKVLSKLRDCNVDTDILKYTPGFVYDESRDMYSLFELYGVLSIGIPMEDTYGNFKRVQLRPDSVMKTAWFSTPGAGNCKAPSTIRFPLYKNYKDFVSGDLKPNKIIYKQVDPETICEKVENETCLIFTEGDYKAVTTCNSLNIPCLSTQGLGSWYNMFVEYAAIKKILYKRNKEVTKAFIAFDCDTKFKRGLIDKGKGVHRVLKSEEVETFYITWKSEYGKGIDDVINNGHEDKLIIVNADIYERKYDLIIEILTIRSRKLSIYLEEDDIKPHYEDLEELTVKELEDKLEIMKTTSFLIEKMSGKKMSDLDNDEISKFSQKLDGKTLDELRDIKKKYK